MHVQKIFSYKNGLKSFNRMNIKHEIIQKEIISYVVIIVIPAPDLIVY